MSTLWAIAKIVFGVLVIVLGCRGDITLGDYLIIMALLCFVVDPERRTK